jgi:hypothetical protein
MGTTAAVAGPSRRRQITTWLLLSIPAGPAFGLLAAYSGDPATVLWLVAGTWTLGTGAALYPELRIRDRNVRMLGAGLFGLLCTAVAAAATYAAIIAFFVFACDGCLS